MVTFYNCFDKRKVNIQSKISNIIEENVNMKLCLIKFPQGPIVKKCLLSGRSPRKSECFFYYLRMIDIVVKLWDRRLYFLLSIYQVSLYYQRIPDVAIDKALHVKTMAKESSYNLVCKHILNKRSQKSVLNVWT